MVENQGKESNANVGRFHPTPPNGVGILALLVKKSYLYEIISHML